MVYVAWATVLSGIVFARRSKLALALAALLGGVVLFVSNLNWLDPQITPLVPVLKSYWLMIHVSVITASYGFFGICAACGIASLIATIAGKNLAELRIINEMAMLVGLVLLTTGIFFGAVWANESWGRYWGWNPKETWALITMIVYAVTTHLHFIPRLNTNPLVFDVMSVVGFSTVLMTFFGVNYYLSGLHSYGKSEGFSPEIVLAAGAGVLVLVAVAAVRYHKNKKSSDLREIQILLRTAVFDIDRLHAKPEPVTKACGTFTTRSRKSFYPKGSTTCSTTPTRISKRPGSSRGSSNASCNNGRSPARRSPL